MNHLGQVSETDLNLTYLFGPKELGFIICIAELELSLPFVLISIQ